MRRWRAILAPLCLALPLAVHAQEPPAPTPAADPSSIDAGAPQQAAPPPGKAGDAPAPEAVPPPPAMDGTEGIVPPVPPADKGGPVLAPTTEGSEAPFSNPDAPPPPVDGPPVTKPAFEGPVQIEGMITGFSALPNLDLQRMTETRDRPVFLPSRRAIAEAQPEAPPADAPPPEKIVEVAPFDYILTGIIRSDSESLAILSQPGIAVPLKAKVSDIVNGFTVVRIEPRSVVMQGADGSEHTLTIFDNQASFVTGADGKQTLRLGPGAGSGMPPEGAPIPQDTAPPPDVGQPPPPPQPPSGAIEGDVPRKVRQVY